MEGEHVKDGLQDTLTILGSMVFLMYIAQACYGDYHKSIVVFSMNHLGLNYDSGLCLIMTNLRCLALVVVWDAPIALHNYTWR